MADDPIDAETLAGRKAENFDTAEGMKKRALSLWDKFTKRPTLKKYITRDTYLLAEELFDLPEGEHEIIDILNMFIETDFDIAMLPNMFLNGLEESIPDHDEVSSEEVEQTDTQKLEKLVSDLTADTGKRVIHSSDIAENDNIRFAGEALGFPISKDPQAEINQELANLFNYFATNFDNFIEAQQAEVRQSAQRIAELIGNTDQEFVKPEEFGPGESSAPAGEPTPEENPEEVVQVEAELSPENLAIIKEWGEIATELESSEETGREFPLNRVAYTVQMDITNFLQLTFRNTNNIAPELAQHIRARITQYNNKALEDEWLKYFAQIFKYLVDLYRAS